MADTKGLPIRGMLTLVRTENGSVKIRTFEASQGWTLMLLPGQGSGPLGIEPLADRLEFDARGVLEQVEGHSRWARFAMSFDPVGPGAAREYVCFHNNSGEWTSLYGAH